LQSVCGVSIVEDYYRFQKFNVAEIASKKNMEKSDEGGIFQTTDSAASKEKAGIVNDD